MLFSSFSTRDIFWVPCDITPLRSHAGLILPDPLLCCPRAVSCTWRGLASCLANHLEAGDGGEVHQADLATNPQYRSQLPSQRKRQGCSKSCGLGRLSPAGWSTYHQEVPLPIEENPMKSSICMEASCPALPFSSWYPWLGNSGSIHTGVSASPAQVRIFRQAATPKSQL